MAARKIKPNVKFIEQLKARLRENPAGYDQASFGNCKSYSDDATEAERNLCGTPMCIAGHAFLMTGKTLKQLTQAHSGAVIAVAAEAMGFTYDQVDTLFGGGCYWPKQFHLGDSDSKKKKVEKACNYLDAMVEAVTLQNEKPYLFELWD